MKNGLFSFFSSFFFCWFFSLPLLFVVAMILYYIISYHVIPYEVRRHLYGFSLLLVIFRFLRVAPPTSLPAPVRIYVDLIGMQR